MTDTHPERASAQFDDTIAGDAPRLSSPTLTRGTTVGRYLILDVQGAGGMGVVYAAYDPELDRKVALKLVRHGGDEAKLTRVLREAQGIARLAHPNVVAVHDVGSVDDGVFIAMELVEGDPLSRWLNVANRSVPEILAMFAQAGRGLAAAHAAGLVHRDFKPDNVLVGHDGRARVVDFGLVHGLDSTTMPPALPVRPSESLLATPMTMVGAVMGTPFYMAPEQLCGEKTEARTDQYAFCVSLFEAFAGRVPFGGATFEEVRANVLTGELAELPPARRVPMHVRAAIRRGMSHDPAARFASMDALLEELARDPAARRRRWLVAGGLAAIVGAAIAIPLALQTSRSGAGTPTCSGAARQLADAWGAPRRAALQQAFAATRQPYADGAFVATAGRLDAYASAWVASHEQSCRATHERHEQSPDMLDLRTACLQRRRTELATLVDLLVDADAAAVQRAHTAVATLSPVADCDDIVALQAPTRPPADPATRQAITDASDELARVTALFAAGHTKDAETRGTTLLARALELKHQPLIAEARLQLGRILHRSGKSEDSRREHVAAFAAALASRSDDLAFRAAVQLVSSTADTKRFENAYEWAALAGGLLEKLGTPDDQSAMLHYARGYLHSVEGDFAKVIEEHERARALREKTRSLELARTLSFLAYAYDEVGRYAEARAAGERSLAIQEGELGPMHPAVAYVLTNLGNIASDEGDQDEATDYYLRALAIREKTVPAGDDPLLMANVLNNLGSVAYERGRHDEAIAYYDRALVIRRAEKEDGDIAMSLANIAAARRAQGHHREALAGFQASRALAESVLGADHPYVGDAQAGIGDTLYLMRDLAGARVAYERALAIRTRGARPVELGDVEFGLAKVLWDAGDRVRALERSTSARARFAASPSTSSKLADVDRWLADHAR